MERAELMALVDGAFTDSANGLTRWPDPWRDRQVPEDAYSQVTSPERYKIIGARVDAWAQVLVELDVMTLERDAAPRWSDERRERIARIDRWVPTATAALPLVVARTEVGGADVGVLLAAGDPAVLVERFPDCGCDACDSGSQRELDELDRHVVGVVTGTFRRLKCSNVTIRVDDDPESLGWGGSGRGPRLRRQDVAAILADPDGWDEVSGGSWFG